LTDPTAVAACIECHDEQGLSWEHPSSHQLLLYCTTCHEIVRTDTGAGHARTRPCSDCHSEAMHNGACAVCHDPHGSSNAFVVRERIAVPAGGDAPIHLTTSDGASPDGLVRAGVAGEIAGTGLCEVCHTATAFYTSAGAGAGHFTEPCAGCHLHVAGFAPPGP